jgi:hypothetical protein
VALNREHISQDGAVLRNLLDHGEVHATDISYIPIVVALRLRSRVPLWVGTFLSKVSGTTAVVTGIRPCLWVLLLQRTVPSHILRLTGYWGAAVLAAVAAGVDEERARSRALNDIADQRGQCTSCRTWVGAH